jgi:hypothetical protein
MTAYDVIVGGEPRLHLNNKADAIKKAVRTRIRERAAVKVVTARGTVVFEKPAPKAIRQSPKYSRVVPLPEGVKAPKGMRVAYVRPRSNGAILHDGKDRVYRIMKLDTGEVLKSEYHTAGEAGDVLTKGV